MLVDVYYLLEKGASASTLLNRFLHSMAQYSPGCEPTTFGLFVIVRDGSLSATLHRRLVSLNIRGICRTVVVPDVGLDLGAYFSASSRTDGDIIVCFNSFTEVVADDWLRHLIAPLSSLDIGLAGATASHESPASYGMSGFPPFPNPHIRTTAFAIRRRDFRAMSYVRDIKEKIDANRFECGEFSLSRQVNLAGRSAVVVNSYGAVFNIVDARASRTFREGNQDGLIVSDNRTRQYAEASPEERSRLEKLAWGEAEIGT